MRGGGRRDTGRFGLRTTITAAFALGALGLSAAMAVGTYLAARNYLIDQREHTALRQAFTDASFVRDGLLTSGARVSDVLGAVSPPAQAAIVVQRGDQWFSTSLESGAADVPERLQHEVSGGTAALTWHDGNGGPSVAVGIPLPAVNAHFYEVSRTVELQRTLNALRVVLLVVAVCTAAAGALLGRWASRRVVAPLDDVAGAAARIASGSFDTRLATTHDPDLVTIVASFNSMVDAVNERIERDARFAADVSHELRTPLTTLVTSVDVLAGRRAELSPRSQQALELIERDLARFRRALEDLLELGRLEAGSAALVMRPVDARDVVRHAVETAGHPPELVTGRAAPAPVLADKSALHRAVVNLVENADRHGGGVTGVSVTAVDGSVAIRVDDRGPGVPAADRERIFQRFVRGGSRGSLPGTGLGLSLVAETVRAHRGSVWCEPGPGGCGTRFTVLLPARSGSEAAP